MTMKDGKWKWWRGGWRLATVMSGLGCAALAWGTGCVYSSDGIYAHFTREANPARPAMVWSERERAFAVTTDEDATVRFYSRHVIYPEGFHFTRACLPEMLLRLPTLPFELLLDAKREEYWQVTVLDRNSAGEGARIREFQFSMRTKDGLLWPQYVGRLGVLIGQEGFPDYARSCGRSEEEVAAGMASRPDGRMERGHVRSGFDDWLDCHEPVLWWDDGAGTEHLLVLRTEKDGEGVAGQELLLFDGGRLAKTIGLGEGETIRVANNWGLPFVTLDGRFVDVFNTAWVYRPYFMGVAHDKPGRWGEWLAMQVDLETGSVQTVGRLGRVPESGAGDGFEVRTEKLRVVKVF